MRNLILSAVGDNSLHKSWISEKDPTFDLFLVYYGNEENKYKNDATHYVQRKGNKYFMFYDLLQQKHEVFDRYDNVLIMDDDLHTETSHLNRFFKIFSDNEFWLAQPSLLGWYTHEITLHDPKWNWRCTNFVELMCPCFNRFALDKCKETFIENEIGWGIDWLWWKLLDYPKDKMAIIDDAIVVHTRPVASGDFYKNNNTSENSLDILNDTIKKYQLNTEYKTYFENSKWKNINCMESKDRFYPDLKCYREFVDNLRKPKRISFI